MGLLLCFAFESVLQCFGPVFTVISEIKFDEFPFVVIFWGNMK